MESKLFKHSYEKVFKATKKALKNLEMKIMETDFERKTIIASTSTSFFSWGEDIQIRFKIVQNDINVIVDSNSKAQLIDWGTNSQNEVDLMKEIEKNL